MAGSGSSLRIRAIRSELTLASAMCALLMGCSSVGTEIATLGSARTGRQIPIRVPAGEVLPATEWPKACRLIDRDDLRAILPDATDIDQMPLRGATRTIEEFVSDEFWHESQSPTEAGCLYSFHLPGEANDTSSSVWVEITEIADPDLIRRYHEEESRGDAGSMGFIPGVDDCYLHNRYDPQLICRSGPVRFSVGGSTSAVFDEYGEAFSYWRDEVLPRFATNVGNKIGGDGERPAGESE
jgi:hypothetical protein